MAAERSRGKLVASERDQGNLVAAERDQCKLVSCGRGELMVQGRVGEGNGTRPSHSRLKEKVDGGQAGGVGGRQDRGRS